MTAHESAFAPGFTFRVSPYGGQLLVVDQETSDVVAGIRMGTPYCKPEYRGRGLGSAMVCFAETARSSLLAPIALSVDSFRARKGAHRRLVEAALAKDPDDVPAEVVAQYKVEDWPVAA